MITEKMDGENTSLYRGGIHARSIDGRHHPSRDWVKALHGSIRGEIPEGWRLCGENLYARHSIAYHALESYFYLFSIWDENNQALSWDETCEWVEMLGLTTVPELFRGEWDETAARELAGELDLDRQEGYVVAARRTLPLRRLWHLARQVGARRSRADGPALDVCRDCRQRTRQHRSFAVTKKSKLIGGLRDGDFPPPGELLDALEAVFPLIGEMASTPQDPEWHAEGSVRVHCEMVIEESYKLTDGLDPDETQALILSAALHDVGKPLVTREEVNQGRIRITSPRHASRGRSYAAPRMPDLEVPELTKKRVLAGIGHHHDPRDMLSRNAQQSRFWRFARAAEAKMIYLLELADSRGRIHVSPDADSGDTSELFRLAAEEAGIWEVENPYAEWDGRIAKQLAGESDNAIEYVKAHARYQFEAGEIFTPEEAIAKTHEHRADHAELVITCAPSGSGKSSWIDENLPNHTRISLDDIREEVTGRRDRMKQEGKVMQIAKKRLREALHRKDSIVWDATCLRKDGRAMISGLGHDYHALTTIVAFATPPEVLFQRNQKRKHQIPTAVIEKQLANMEWPNPWEAHRLITV